MNRKLDMMVSMAVFSSVIMVGLQAFADVATSWDVTDTSSEKVVVYDAGQNVTVQFPKRLSSLDIPYRCDLLVGGANPSSTFTGDLRSYKGISFRVLGDGFKPESISVVVERTVGVGNRQRTSDWVYKNSAVSVSPGEWMINLIPLAEDKGWESSGATWDYVVGDVSSVVLRIIPSGYNAQKYSISNFQLMGENGPSEPAQLTSLQAYFGIDADLDEIDKKMDTDGDGMSDWNELLAGMDPLDATSVFAAKTKKNENGRGNIIEWQGVLGASYVVWKATSLSGTGNFTIAEGSQTSAEYTGEILTYEDTDPADGANFYKIYKY